jgi:hypothetical protein
MKAFDTVHHKLLLQKLKVYQLPEKVISLISSYLSDRKQLTIVNSKKSSILPITHGVPQGSILGPLLFLIYINDLPLAIRCESELFADDTTLHDSKENIILLRDSLQADINSLQKWCELNHMAIHPVKTKAMLITCWQKRQVIDVLPFSLSFNNQKISVESKHKLLGVIVDHNLLWSEHIRATGNIISKKLYQLAQIKNFLPQHAKKLFFHAYIMSLISYCSTLWDSCSNNARTPFDRLHKRAVKNILNKAYLTDGNLYQNFRTKSQNDKTK